jgi:hypothetical protein
VPSCSTRVMRAPLGVRVSASVMFGFMAAIGNYPVVFAKQILP